MFDPSNLRGSGYEDSAEKNLNNGHAHLDIVKINLKYRGDVGFSLKLRANKSCSEKSQDQKSPCL